jgi:phospholipid/cholesterol/gamma-HCH transport system substrate-binding protein
MKLSKEIKVGFVTIIAIALLFWGFNFLKGTNLFVQSKSVYAVYPKVPGLSASAPIIINGVQSGVVDDIYFHPDKSSRVIVKLSITENELHIPKNSIAELISVDFLGSKAIGLNLGDSDENLNPGDTIQSYFEKSMLEDFSEQMLPIKDKAEHLMLSMDTAVIKLTETLNNINGMFTDRNRNNLRLALANLSTTIQDFDILAKTLNSTIKTKVNPALSQYSAVADSIKSWDVNATLKKAQTTLDTMSMIMAKVNNGEGTMGQLINNDSLYKNLEAVSRDMDLLLIEVKEHPRRFVHFSLFGRKDKARKEK